jgi:hypothetical protein
VEGLCRLKGSSGDYSMRLPQSKERLSRRRGRALRGTTCFGAYARGAVRKDLRLRQPGLRFGTFSGGSEPVKKATSNAGGRPPVGGKQGNKVAREGEGGRFHVPLPSPGF